MVATLILYTAGRGIAQLITRGQITYIRVDSFKMAGEVILENARPTPIFLCDHYSCYCVPDFEEDCSWALH